MKILIAHDGSMSSDTGIEDMRRAGLPRDAKAFVMSMSSAGSSASGELAEAVGDRIRSYFPEWDLSSEVLSGSPAENLLKTSDWWRPDLLVIGSDLFKLERSMTSTVSLEVVHRAKCSVRVVRSRAPAAEGRIHLLVGTSGSKACEAVVNKVAQRQWPIDTEIHIVSVVDSTSLHDEEYILDKTCINRLQSAGLSVGQIFIPGDAGQQLVRESERVNADTIFVGPRRLREAGRFLLGSVATAVVTRARCTVEVVR